jgi:iron complex outermembrane receptor protein
MTNRTPGRFFILFAFAANHSLRADASSLADDDDEIIVIRDSEKSRAPGAQRALDEPAFLTEVRVEERTGESATVAGVLAESVGAQVRTLGGLGGFASLSVRGAAPGHTTILIDGVPLSRVASVGADIGRFELGSFSRLELYRGGVPVEYGGAALGGALNMVTKAPCN